MAAEEGLRGDAATLTLPPRCHLVHCVKPTEIANPLLLIGQYPLPSRYGLARTWKGQAGRRPVGDRRFGINAPAVVSEIIDGEVVIMNLTSGNYYSSDGVGAVIWGCIEGGRTLGDIERLLSLRYRAGAEDIAAALAAFFDRLIEERLVREIALPPTPAADNGQAFDGAAGRERFVLPALHVYTDMQDLLLLDPIHDVDEAGWPRPRDDKPGDPA